MKIKFYIVLSLILILVGCLGFSSIALAQVAKEDIVLGFSSPFLYDPFQVALQEQTMAEAKLQGIKCLEPVNANQDAAKQVNDIQTLISLGANAIIVVPTDARALMPAIRYCNEKNVPVVCIDMAPEEPGAYITVRANNVQMGNKGADWVGETLNGKGKVLEIQGDLQNRNGADRAEGFETQMAEKFSGIDLISRPGKWQPELSGTITQTVLSSNPGIEVIFMASTALYLSGVQGTLKMMNLEKPVGEQGHILLIGIDGTPYDHDMIRERRLDAVVSQPLDMYAKYGVQHIINALAGIEPKLGPTDHDSEIVLHNGILQDLLPSPIVTLENVDAPNFWGNMVKGY